MKYPELTRQSAREGVKIVSTAPMTLVGASHC
jgi:hypothetical protein